jgi:D-arabinose 1-dehydrogenase-like Zn-dependent alcohol dehydrogenase
MPDTRVESTVVELPKPLTIEFVKYTLNSEDLGSNELLAETICSAISTGTEVAAYRGDKPLRPGGTYPRVVGYCNVAEVKRIGTHVNQYQPGDRILSFQSHRSAFVCSEDSVILKIPGGCDLHKAATTFLYHLGYESLLKGHFKPGHNVAVIGLGTLGIATVDVGCRYGANVFAFSNQGHSLTLARELGSKLCFRKDDANFMEEIEVATHGIGIDIVITTANTWNDWKLALEVIRDEGTICVLGFPGRTQPLPDFNPLEPQYLYFKKLSVVYCGYTPDYLIPPKDIRFTRKRNCESLLDMIAENRLKPEKIISQTYPWTQIQKAYDDLMKRDPPLYTAILTYRANE